jgi:hypothetical protein
MDGFAVLIERAVDSNFLAFVLLYQVLAINVVRSAARVLQYVFVSALHDRPGEDLPLRGLPAGLGIGSLLSGLIRRL